MQRFNLTASALRGYFKHRCDRLFRWDAVDSKHRNRAGIGWNVPARVRSHSRPGIRLLMEMGDAFEVDQIQALIDDVGADQIRWAGVTTERGRTTVASLSLDDLLDTLRQRSLPIYIAQVEVDLSSQPDQEEQFLRRFGLDPNRVKLGSARPDLLEVIPPENDGPHLLRIWDFKASQSARHEHFVQVAYYTFLLEQVLAGAGITDVAVDVERAVIYTRQDREEFELAPYRLAVEDFLRSRAMALFNTPAADAHYHVREKCAMCEYMDHCRSEADAHYDLSRIAYLSSESKRQLRRANLHTHRDLARIAAQDKNELLLERLRTASHDLSVNLARYVATAQALEDGQPRLLEATTLQMPQYEDVRIVLSAEQDPVTATCFALGIKTYEGWDGEQNRPLGMEEVFIAEKEGDEVTILLDFLRTLNRLLERIDAGNRAIQARSVEDDPSVVAARQALEQAAAAHAQFKDQHNPIRKTNPRYEELRATRSELADAEKEAGRALKKAQGDAEWEKVKQQARLHFYVYDSIDLLVLKELIERHLFDEDPPELLDQMRTLVRLFPPESVLPDAESFRTMPGTVVIDVLRTLVALPVPYLYDLHSVSELYQPQTGAWTYRPRYGFGWEHSNQVAFERIHDVWRDQTWTLTVGGAERELTPPEILETIDQTVRSKLRATDSVVRRLKQEMGDRLRLRKEPFQLYREFDPMNFRMLEALRIFTLLEASYDELQVKHFHTLPVDDRAAKFECIRGLRYQADRDEDDGSLWFTFDPACRDAKFDEGDFTLIVTPEDEPERLLGDVDGELFSRSFWRHRPYKVTLLEYDLASDPPRVRLQPDNTAQFRERLDLSRPCVLDRLYTDFNSPKVLDVLHRLQNDPAQARHIHELTAAAAVTGWRPFVLRRDELAAELRRLVQGSGGNADGFLNDGQWRAWHGVFQEPLTLIWGPPGTGKTYTLAHILLGYALAARREGHPIRILVTAFTHHAINNVLKKVAELADAYGIGPDDLAIAKVFGWSPHPSDEELPVRVENIPEDGVPDYLGNESSCVVVGSTVWGTYKAMDKGESAIQPWFDVVLVDEASQMKLPDALIALSASRPSANIILAGDDRQLPPIIHGSYPEEHEYMLSSVFAFMRHRMEERASVEPDVEERLLFQLEENFRMNEPLTAYPRQVLYRGRFFSTQPHIRMETQQALEADSDDLIDFLLHPERPVVLCQYESPRSFTARNPIEAHLIAQLVERLHEVLIDQRTGSGYDAGAFAARGVAVLSPHRAQNSTIRQVLMTNGFGNDQRPLPLVDTVDKLQGQERDVVFVSYGVADEEYAEAEADFLLSSNRFNVAATRPRHKLIVFCSVAVLDVVPTDQKILLDSMMLKEFRTYCADGRRLFTLQTQEHGEIPLTVQWKAFGDSVHG